MQLILTQPGAYHDEGHENLAHACRLVVDARLALTADDILLLPELIGGRSTASDYEAWVGDLARTLGCHVVGGTHHEPGPEGDVNRGVVADPGGAVIARYD